MQSYRSKLRILSLLYQYLRNRCIMSLFHRKLSTIKIIWGWRLSSSSIWRMLRCMIHMSMIRSSRSVKTASKALLKTFQPVSNSSSNNSLASQIKQIKPPTIRTSTSPSISPKTLWNNWQRCMRCRRHSSSIQPLRRWTNCGFSISACYSRCEKRI